MRLSVPLIFCVLLCSSFSTAWAQERGELTAHNLSEANSQFNDVYPYLSADGQFYYTIEHEKVSSEVFAGKRLANGKVDSLRPIRIIGKGAIAAMTFDTIGNTYFSSNADGMS